jgi:hypothetical protein
MQGIDRAMRKVSAMGTRHKWIGILVMVVGLLLLGADFGYTDRGGHGHKGHGGHGFRGHHHHHHHRHGGSGVRIGIGFGTFWGPYWPHYAYPPVVVAPPPVVVQPSPLPPQYWYWCDSAQAYYPYVAQCPSGWRAVTPTSP